MSVAIGRSAGIVMAPASSTACSASHARGLVGATSATAGHIEIRTLPLRGRVEGCLSVGGAREPVPEEIAFKGGFKIMKIVSSYFYLKLETFFLYQTQQEMTLLQT